MIDNQLGQQLHDRFTRGETLSDIEQAQLEQWYTLEDRLEAEVLNIRSPSDSLEILQTQVNKALARLSTATQKIQEIATENEAIRHEIASIYRQIPDLITLT